MIEKLLQSPLAGTSMQPGLLAGDVLLIDLNSIQKEENGDILFFKNTVLNDFTVHRMINNLENKTKGDLSIIWDDIDPRSTLVLGTVVGIKRKNKIIYWGMKGQPLKKIIAKSSSFRTKNFFIGKLAKVSTYIIIKISFLICSIPTKHRT
jgi:hypothetical protein